MFWIYLVLVWNFSWSEFFWNYLCLNWLLFVSLSRDTPWTFWWASQWNPRYFWSRSWHMDWTRTSILRTGATVFQRYLDSWGIHIDLLCVCNFLVFWVLDISMMNCHLPQLLIFWNAPCTEGSAFSPRRISKLEVKYPQWWIQVEIHNLTKCLIHVQLS